MSHRTTRAPAEAHSLPATVLTAAAAVVAVFAAVAVVSAPGTAVTVAATVVAVLAVQRGRKALATRGHAGHRDSLGTPRHAG
ncbi:hypothetical protein [Halobacterium salinarum]|uniref:Uncharacterized protein n=1 Tax=Halobacterium salinarum (strain ATCC 33171 / DSM 3754 / JCM 8978 / NBRC 102687 / NCIMB 764 / 91-R6) TaxID=2597657 RepID=A0A4D6GWD3_HALS9|nr:hypothetical protein [Halobacterium salinarum]QCC44878.1 uncharacterized protein HBSAL_06080 [Halobacterium salinarum]TYO75538.1 hypothetical protein APQ99_01861 [Halobacterium salinarum DSM 3754]